MKKHRICRMLGLFFAIGRDIRTAGLQATAIQGSGQLEVFPSVSQGTKMGPEAVRWLSNDMERRSVNAVDGIVRILGCQVTGL